MTELEEVIKNYSDEINNKDYKTIFSKIGPTKYEQLGALLKALKEIEVEPFKDIPDKINIDDFAQLMLYVGKGFQLEFFAKSLDFDSESINDKEALDIVKVCHLFGLKVFEVEAGYWGSKDYAITSPKTTAKSLNNFTNLLLNSLEPSFFKEVKFE